MPGVANAALARIENAATAARTAFQLITLIALPRIVRLFVKFKCLTKPADEQGSTRKRAKNQAALKAF